VFLFSYQFIINILGSVTVCVNEPKFFKFDPATTFCCRRKWRRGRSI